MLINSQYNTSVSPVFRPPASTNRSAWRRRRPALGLRRESGRFTQGIPAKKFLIQIERLRPRIPSPNVEVVLAPMLTSLKPVDLCRLLELFVGADVLVGIVAL